MLTPGQIEARRGRLTGSRVACLMTADAEKIMRLYREMIGEAVEEDLSDVWPVRLGEATEALNLEWYERKNSCTLTRRGEVAIHPTYNWAAATLDGWDPNLNCPIEAKHVGGREPMETVIDRYQPQVQWQCEVAGAEQCALSIIVGASIPVVEFIACDVDYAAEMIVRGRQFMECVAARRPPVVLAAVPSPIDASKLYDFTGDNRWADAAADWLETKDTARKCAEVTAYLKSIVPADARKAFGHGVQITRDRAGRLSLREVA